MIPFNFEYYKPSSIGEAVQLYQYLLSKERQPIYYSGGTEIITMGRKNRIYTDAVIDIKGIPECNRLGIKNGQLTIGEAVTLNYLSESNLFPLLGKTASDIADHTTRNKITLGGNIMGNIPFREAILPLLLSDSDVIIAGPKGITRKYIMDVFDKTLRLEKGKFLVQVVIDESFLNLPFVSIKKTKQAEIDYPLVTVAALKKGDEIRFAFSGVCPFPFRSREMERLLNQRDIPIKDRVDSALNLLPAPIVNNLQGSKEYRRYILVLTLYNTIITLEGA